MSTYDPLVEETRSHHREDARNRAHTDHDAAVPSAFPQTPVRRLGGRPPGRRSVSTASASSAQITRRVRERAQRDEAERQALAAHLEDGRRSSPDLIVPVLDQPHDDDIEHPEDLRPDSPLARRIRKTVAKRTFLAARKPVSPALKQHSLGKMDIACRSCGALHWKAECLSTSTIANPVFGLCCDSGQVRLPPLQRPPLLLQNLFDSDTQQARAFRKNIRQYNNAFAFTSLGVQHDRHINTSGRSAWVFRIHGELCHWSSALERSDNETPSFAQVYIYDPTHAHSIRVRNNDNLDAQLLLDVENMLRDVNPYAGIYEHAHRVLSTAGVSADVSIRLRVVPGLDRRIYNVPSAEEVAMILPGDASLNMRGRDIIIRRRTSAGQHNLFRINEYHAAYAPLQFVLLFPRGESGWHDQLQMYQPDSSDPARLTQMRYAAYRLQVRPDNVEYNLILRGGQLMQQYVVDMWASAEQNRLRWLRFNQAHLRADLYNGLADAITSADDHVDLHSIGRCILPSSHTGGPRDLQHDIVFSYRRFRR